MRPPKRKQIQQQPDAQQSREDQGSNDAALDLFRCFRHLNPLLSPSACSCAGLGEPDREAEAFWRVSVAFKKASMPHAGQHGLEPPFETQRAGSRP